MSDAAPLGPDAYRRVPAPVRRAARHAPAAPALIDAQGQAVTYGALDVAVDRVAARLEAAGVEAGEHVACLLPRTPAYVTLLLALWRCGAVAAPLPARVPAAGRGPLLKAIAARTLVARSQEDASAPPHVDVLPAESLSLTEDFLSAGSAGEAEAGGGAPARWAAERPMTLVFTSGSTGAPKAALHTAGNHFFSAEGSRQNVPLERGDRWLLSLPLYHVGGLAIVLRCLWAGAAVAFPAEEESLAAAARRAEATHVSLVATQLRRLLEAMRAGGEGNNAAASPLKAALEAVLLGGGPAPPALVEEACAAGLPLAVSYGLTEMASQVTTTAPGDPARVLLQTAGRPLPHRRVHIRTEEPGAPAGEILVGGATRFAGYVEGGHLRQPFEEAAGEGGWFATGDRGRLDAAGRLRVAGRLDRRFVSGGENVQPEEIEAALRRLPSVASAAVVPVPHEAFGQRPVAFIRSARPAPFRPRRDAAPLRAALEEALPKYKVPDAFYAWPEEDAEGAMKPDYTSLQARARRLARRRGGGGKTEEDA